MTVRDVQDFFSGTDITERMLQERIIAIFRGFTAEQANMAAEALVEGGIRFMEVTMNTADAAEIISHWRERFAGRAYIGAGTVIDIASAREALTCGAQFLISPNLDEEVIAYAAERGVDRCMARGIDTNGDRARMEGGCEGSQAVPARITWSRICSGGSWSSRAHSDDCNRRN